MTERQYELTQALARCTFPPASSVKRFVKWLGVQPPTHALSDKAAAFVERLAHSYRRQLGRCMAEKCEVCK